MRFLLNRDRLKELARLRGWRSIYTRLSEEMGLSVSYCRRVVLGREKLTDFFMLKYIKVAGCNPNKPAEWSRLFDVCLDGVIPKDHSPAFNGFKYDALGMKYRHASSHYSLRRMDNPDVEEESLEDFIGDKFKTIKHPS